MEGGFSIREYASRMRSINVANCWPFDESMSEEAVKSLLPPIVIKRFTWWVDELELLSSETAEKLEISQKKTNKVSEKGETSSKYVCKDIEEGGPCVKAAKLKSLKGKMRATKKRSIVDIFAMAPPVKEGEEEEDDDDVDAHCNLRISRASKKKKRVRSTDAILKKALRVVKKIKRRKESSFKLKLPTQEIATGNLSDFASLPKTKPTQQDFGPFKKLGSCKSSKLIEESQDPELPVRGILKNYEKLSLKKSNKSILKEAVHLNKRVTFSGNGEIPRSSRKLSQSMQCFELQKGCGFDKGNAVAVGKDSTVSETSGSGDAYNRTGKELGATNEWSTALDVNFTTFAQQKCEYSNRCESSEGNTMCSINQNLPNATHMPHDSYYNSSNLKVVTASSNATLRRPDKDIGTPCPINHPLCFVDYLRTHNNASMSNMRRTYELTQATAFNCAHSIHYQEYPYLYPDEMLGAFSSVPDGSPTGDCHGRNINEEFVGLPLNSQGELIAVNSFVSGSESIGLSIPSNTVSKGQLNLFPVETHVQENASMAALPSRLGIMKSQGEKANLDFDLLEINYHPFLNLQKNLHSRGDGHAQKISESEKLQSTMRLMGKEFEVSGRGVERFEDGCTWKDKQVIDKLHFQNAQNEPCFRQFGETLYHPSETSVDHISESNYSVPGFYSLTNAPYKNMFRAGTVDCAQNLYPGLSAGTFSKVYNNKPLFSEPCTTGHDCELRSDMIPGAMKSKQNLHYAPISSMKFPFMHPDLDANSSWPRRTSPIRHPMFFDATEKATHLTNHPYLNPDTSRGVSATVPFQSDDFCTFRSFPSLATPTMPYCSGALPVSTMQRLQRKQNKIKARMKSRIDIRGINVGKKSKAPLSPLSNAPFRPFMRPTVHEDSYPEAARNGPIKLTAGAKHVLKLRLLKDPDISLSATNTGFRFSESENATNVYQF